MRLQVITICAQMYASPIPAVDFITRVIFRGGDGPSVRSMIDSVARALKRWREPFSARLPAIRAHGYSERFPRMWDFYLCNCDGGFEDRQLGDVQMLLTKPRSRRAGSATVHAAQA